MLITFLGPIIRGVQKLSKSTNSDISLAEKVKTQTEDTRDLGRKLSLDPLNLLTTPIERLLTSMEAFNNKVPTLLKKDPEHAKILKQISENLFESSVNAISNRVKIMEKLPNLKDMLENLYKKESDEGTKLALELLEELRAVQNIKWTRDGFNAFNSFASRDRGVRSVFGKNFNSWNDFLDAARDKFSNVLSSEFLHKFRINEKSSMSI